jgi:hypothetical protein
MIEILGGPLIDAQAERGDYSKIHKCAKAIFTSVNKIGFRY